MAVELEYISLIIPISKIEEHYPGGFKQYKTDNADSIKRRIWYDQYLVRDGAMNGMDMEMMIREWEMMGFTSITQEDGQQQWKDLCVVDFFGGMTLPCKWLKKKKNTVFHIHDKTNIVINRNSTKKQMNELSSIPNSH